MKKTIAMAGLACALATPTAAMAQDDIESGVTTAGDVELGLGASGSASGSGSGSAGGSGEASPARRTGGYGSAGSGGTRIGLQLRIDAVNVLAASGSTVNGVSGNDYVPLAMPGVRFLDGRLYLGLGLGFQYSSEELDNGDEESRSGFTLSPGASYDVLGDDSAALSVGGWLNIASLGETEECDGGGCSNNNDDQTGLGLTLAAGVRGKLLEGLAIGGEFGWGFLSISEDAGDDTFVHAIVATILFEATVGI